MIINDKPVTAAQLLKLVFTPVKFDPNYVEQIDPREVLDPPSENNQP